MKPAGFAYLATEGLEEALTALSAHGDEAKIIAGGQSLVPLMNMRLAKPGVLIDINKITQLAGIEMDGVLSIGALTRQQEVQGSAEVRSFAPVVVEALAHVGYPAIRSRGTFGGSAAHADPAAEIPALLVLLDAELVIRGSAGERTVPASEFFKGYFTTALEPVEILTSVRIPRPPDGIRWSFSEVARRHGDFALVGVMAGAAVDGDGKGTSVRSRTLRRRRYAHSRDRSRGCPRRAAARRQASRRGSRSDRRLARAAARGRPHDRRVSPRRHGDPRAAVGRASSRGCQG